MRKLIKVKKVNKIFRNEQGVNYPDGNFQISKTTHVSRAIKRGDLVVIEEKDNSIKREIIEEKDINIKNNEEALDGNS